MIEPGEKNMILAALRLLAHEFHENSLKKGFWDKENALLDLVASSNKDEGTKVLLESTIVNLVNTEKIALGITELSEAIERNRRNPNTPDEHCPNFTNFEIELADAIIRILEFGYRRNMRVGEAVLAKNDYNVTRAYMHGKAF